MENGESPRKKELPNSLAAKHTAHRESVVAIIVILRIHPTRIDVQVVRVVATVERRRPEVAVRAQIVLRRAVKVAREGRGRRIESDTRWLQVVLLAVDTSFGTET